MLQPCNLFRTAALELSRSSVWQCFRLAMMNRFRFFAVANCDLKFGYHP